MNFTRKIADLPIIGGLVCFLYRITIVGRFLAHRTLECLRWLATSRETTNFTYDISPYSRKCLASTLACIFKKEPEEIERYFSEIETDTGLREHIAAALAADGRKNRSDRTFRYGKRIAWCSQCSVKTIKV
jgi:hypothetical protein